ncbi:PEP-utilizing enzyme [Marinobacter nauticus]|uniref:PEP-utilizing enzyme n=1 Tax=Marinobacter nauticus TaxID=2743 RepID=UPI001CF93B5D|nr:PEP/pyruvate-binding domain-containing protein [Marinobacter nauticus]
MKQTDNHSNTRLIILGAGKPFKGEQHSVLRGTTGRRRVLDWLLHAMRGLNPQTNFVGGYQLEAVVERYPDLHYSLNPHWETTGAAASLLEAPLDAQHTHYVSYADILFRDSAVDALAALQTEIAILVDSSWRSRYEGRSREDMARCEKVNLHGGMVTRLGRDIPEELADAEFVGLVRLSGGVAGYLADTAAIPESLKSGSLSQLLEYLRIRGFPIAAVDVAGEWAEMNDANDLSRFVLGTKAQTLYRLQGVVTRSRIEDQVSFTVADWLEGSTDVLADIETELAAYSRLVVRSSALSEDGFGVSNAGAYTSILNVERANEEALRSAVEEVIASYPDGHPENQVLVQPMLERVIASGVAFTKTLSSGAPYYVVNYDDTTRSTESITSGSSREHKTLVVRRTAPEDGLCIPDNLAGLLPALREVEDLLDFDSLDIEFAITEGGSIHILQVRPIAVQHELNPDDFQDGYLKAAVARFRELQSPGPFVLGRNGVFGVMPDWNPAEIIGIRPGRLASSLYRYLILDDVWATQRAEYGYRDVRPQPLLQMFAGHPYVDVRASFNSFIPATVPDGLAERLVDFYLGWLRQHPHMHDKVEFDVVPTCYALDFERWRERLAVEGGFQPQEIEQLAEGLRNITVGAVARTDGDLRLVAEAEARFDRFDCQPKPSLDLVFALLEECRRYGTLVFAHLARSGFVAVTLLRSAVRNGVLSQAAVDEFMNSIRTVSHQFTDDVASVAQKRMPFAELVSRYGHLRPGTYDITSACYGENPEQYLAPAVARAELAELGHGDESPMGAWNEERAAFASAMASVGLPSDVDVLERFLRGAIEGRERAKFVFTRHLSLAIECLARVGAEYGLGREQVAGIPLEAFATLRAGQVGGADRGSWLTLRAEEGEQAARAAAMIELPPLLFSEDDFYSFVYSESHANFVGKQRVVAECVDLRNVSNEKGAILEGKVALIPQADPGYDWLFGHGIAGLITMYGGANSHMAIRAAEFGLPAAIGVGEGKYAALAKADVLELDPVNKRIEVIR